MIRALAMTIALTFMCLAAIQLLRERPPWNPGLPLQALDESAPPASDGTRRCKDSVSTKSAIDIARAQSRIRAAAGPGAAALRQQVADFDLVLKCALIKSPADGRILALMAWTAWRLDAPPTTIAELVEQSYRLHPYEVNTAAVRQLVIAANWNRLDDNLRAIGRADQALRFAVQTPDHVVPEIARLYVEAGTSSALYDEALDHLARVAPEFLATFEAQAEGKGAR